MRVRRPALLAGATVVAAIALALTFTGSVILFDPHREVASATLVDGWGKRQHLMSVGVGFVGVPKVEGAVEITCVNGKTFRSGYVTPGTSMWERMGRKCDRSAR